MPKLNGSVLERRDPEPTVSDPDHVIFDGADFAVDVDSFVASRIRQRRRELGVNQRDFARSLGVSLQQVHKYETGANRVSAGRLYVMATTLGVQVDYFYPSAALSAVTEERAEDGPDLGRLVAAITDPAHREVLRRLCGLFIGAERGEPSETPER